MEKKFDFKKFLSNNAIIILIILLALFVGCTTQNFFTETNGKNLLLNVAPRFIIACGVSGCLITKALTCPPAARSAWPPASPPCCCRALTTLPACCPGCPIFRGPWPC